MLLFKELVETFNDDDDDDEDEDDDGEVFCHVCLSLADR